MQAVTRHAGRCAVLRRDDVDTDQIIPAEFCKRLTKNGYQEALFAHWRAEPDFVLNDPACQGASVLIAGANFGTGSSREHAVWALRDWGFAAVIASSFGDIFLRNAWTNGMLAVTLPAAEVAGLAARAAADPAYEVTIDLERCEVRAEGSRWPFEADENARWLLLNGLDDIDVTMAECEAIAAYERTRPTWLPVLGYGAVAHAAEQRLAAQRPAAKRPAGEPAEQPDGQQPRPTAGAVS